MSSHLLANLSGCSLGKALRVDWEALAIRGFKTLRLVLTTSSSRGNPANS